MLSEIKKNVVFFKGLPVALISAAASEPKKYCLLGLASLGALGITGFYIFQVGKAVVATTPVVLEKGVEFLREGTSAAAEFLREGTSTAGDYADFQKFCTLKNGQNTWKSRGNSVFLAGTWCSNLTPAGEDELRKLFPEAAHRREMNNHPAP